MATSTATTVERPDTDSARTGRPPWTRHGGGCGGRGNWSAMNVAAMVIGFVVFWPIGLALLFWIAGGRDVRELPGALNELWGRVRGNGAVRSTRGHTDNVVFNEYQQAQYDKINEIRAEIRARTRRFTEFREAARRRKDQEEFDRFMADSPSSDGA